MPCENGAGARHRISKDHSELPHQQGRGFKGIKCTADFVGISNPPIKAGCPALWVYLKARLEEEHQKEWFGNE
jgi:hypothetical protein